MDCYTTNNQIHCIPLPLVSLRVKTLIFPLNLDKIVKLTMMMAQIVKNKAAFTSTNRLVLLFFSCLFIRCIKREKLLDEIS